MADGFNRVMLLGNLGADPELKMINSGQAVLKMRLATSETYLDRNKVKQEKVEWHSVTLWGKRAEALGKFLSKGARIFVEGSLRTSSYDDRDGNKRTKTEINATNVILLGGKSGKREERDDDPADDGAGFRSEKYGDPVAAPGAGDDDDIPFAPIGDVG